MKKEKLLVFLEGTGLVAATTIGAGIFALPYVFAEAGWLIGIAYLVILSAITIFIHHLYFRVLAAEKERERLLGLVRRYVGTGAFHAAFLAIVGGLILTLVIYLVLGATFLTILFPSLSVPAALFLFWLAGSLPLLFRLPRLVGAEFAGTALMLGIILIVFASSSGFTGLLRAPLARLHGVFLPFGVILFALAAWTAVEPLYEWTQQASRTQAADRTQNNKNMATKRRVTSDRLAVRSLAFGTIISAFFYLLFVAGILSSNGTVAPDTLSGLADWPLWKLWLLAALGLLAIWTSYLPISREVKNALERDMRVPRGISYVTVLIAPILLVVAGLTNFLAAVGVAGGVFLGGQYLAIAFVAERSLRVKRGERIVLYLSAATFLLGALYEIYSFVIA